MSEISYLWRRRWIGRTKSIERASGRWRSRPLGIDELLVNETRSRLAWSSRVSRWKRRGRLRATMVARVHLTPIFPARGSVALSAHRRPRSLSRSRSRSRPRPRSRLCHFFTRHLSSRSSKIQSPFGRTRKRMVHGASGSPHRSPSLPPL